MVLVGEEKRIQALFSEVRLADEPTAPSFAEVWSSAQSKTIRTQVALNFSLMVTGTLLVCVLFSVAWWSKHRHQNPNVVATVSGKPAGQTKSGIESNLRTPAKEGLRPAARAVAHRLALHRKTLLEAANRKTALEVRIIAGWRSPTAKLLDSQSDEFLKSLPQLSQSADELKSFLPGRLR
jgi:hypothetical protein